MTVPSKTDRKLSRLQAHKATAEIDLLAIVPTTNMRYLLTFAPLAEEMNGWIK